MLLASEFLYSLARCIKGKNGTGHALCHWTLQLITSGPMKHPPHVSSGENRKGDKVKYGYAIVEVKGQSFQFIKCIMKRLSAITRLRLIDM